MSTSSIPVDSSSTINSVHAARHRTWRAALKDAVRDPDELCRLVDLPRQYLAGARRAARLFPLFVPREYLARIQSGDPHDPLLRQVLPLDAEHANPPGYQEDPVGDGRATLTPGLLHKYRSRVLMVTTGACAVHCRYCFRRHFPYDTTPRSIDQWRPALEQIERDPTIHEVILSGGDPLTLVDDQIAELVKRLSDVPHVRRLRIHTRLPIMIPQRVTDPLLRLLRASRLPTIVVVHANHANELDESVDASLGRLVDAGLVVLNQAVLLRGVNDSADALVDLCQRLADMRVMPYYLHQLDRVSGAAHFEVPRHIGRRLIAQLRRRLPGYAVPRYVHERPGVPHKMPLA